jgi:hypothetical protein
LGVSNGAAVRDQLVACGWQVKVADARKAKTVAPLAAKTDRIDARLLAELCRRQLVPALRLPSLDERAPRERLRPRMHLVRLRTSATGVGAACKLRFRGRTESLHLTRPVASSRLVSTYRLVASAVCRESHWVKAAAGSTLQSWRRLGSSTDASV